MIISASRRTDIPAFYAGWFANRLRAGSCLVPNPFNPRQRAVVSLARADVDGFVFWTRDPRPFSGVLDLLDRAEYPYAFLFTLTAYGPTLEPFAPARDAAVAAFRALSARIGPERVVWRYDPILFGPGLAPAEHVRRFADLARDLSGCTRTVKISFLDLYRKTVRRLRALPAGSVDPGDPAERDDLGPFVAELATIAGAAGMQLRTCAEARDFSAFGAPPGRCIDPELIAPALDRVLVTAKDPGQRRACRCAPSKDIGMPDSCLHGCVYCYATSGHAAACRNHARHDPELASLLPLAGKPHLAATP